ncbi:ATP-binding protein [Elongatibacter sediminis]|uniref:histidine kinase n=1 Tax=Elongatibacter sediminis TaxID=3119006 RepID=A0AAW9RMH8_9GAMM
MKTLRAKILLALFVSTVLALIASSVLSRVALQRGFLHFLEQQESRQLELLAPELARLYRQQGDWGSLRRDPRRWMRLLARQRPEGVMPPERGEPETGDRPFPPPARAASPDTVRHLWRRLFVLDAQSQWVAGARYGDLEEARTAPITVDGQTVGWVGFRPTGRVMTPEGRQFLDFQRRALLASLAVALLLATGLGFWLARNLARPVGRVGESVSALTDGDFAARTGVRRKDEIGALARDVDRLAETLERNRTARRRWTADVAHELRTPVAILRGELDAMRDGVRTPDPAGLESLHEEVAHLGRLVEDLQTLALADAGALEFRFQSTDVAGLLRQVLDSFEERLRAAGLTLESCVPDRLEARCDRQRLRQVLQNLLENACRYTGVGGIVRVRLIQQEDGYSLEVEDSPPGLSPSQREQLFNRFYRAEPSRGRSGGGSGLGLAICREIVAAHGGSIETDDSELGGLLIRVQLPLEA